MRATGMAARGLELLCRRADSRSTFGSPLSERADIRDWIAAAPMEIAAIKVDAPNVALGVIDRAIQVHAGMGVTEDVLFAGFWAHLRAMRIADGPDEVHKRTIARQELRKQRQSRVDAAEGA